MNTFAQMLATGLADASGAMVRVRCTCAGLHACGADRNLGRVYAGKPARRPAAGGGYALGRPADGWDAALAEHRRPGGECRFTPMAVARANTMAGAVAIMCAAASRPHDGCAPDRAPAGITHRPERAYCARGRSWRPEGVRARARAHSARVGCAS